MGLRRLLAFILKKLAVWAIKKHNMKIAVVAGKHGTKLTGEMLGELLQPEYLVRRQLEQPFWDFSVPLAILGIRDKRYSVWGWLKNIIKTTAVLILGRKNNTLTIIQLNTYKRDIASYWLDILDPDFTILVNVGKRIRYLEKKLIKKTKEFVVAPFEMKKKIRNDFGDKVWFVGENQNSDISVKSIKENNQGTEIKLEINKGIHRSNKLKVFAFQKGRFMHQPIVMSMSASIILGFEPEEVKDKLLQAQINLEQFVYKVK